MRVAIRQVLTILLLALLPAVATGLWHPRRPAWQSDEVTPDAAAAWGQTVLWVDARPDANFARSHIPGALPLNEDRWDNLLPAVLDRWDTEHKVVVYCSSLSCQTTPQRSPPPARASQSAERLHPSRRLGSLAKTPSLIPRSLPT